MRTKVICNILIRGDKTYHKGDYIALKETKDIEMLIHEHCIEQIPEKEKNEQKENKTNNK